MPVSTRVSGTWKTVDAVYTRVGGVWKKVTEVWTRVSGTWKRVHSIPTLAYLNDRRSNDNNLTTYTFLGVAIGTATDDRLVLVNVNGSHASASGRTVSSVTVGGIAAERLAGAQGASGGTIRAEIWAAPVPTGTSATIAIEWSGQMESCTIATFAAAGLNQTAPRATANSPTPATGSESVTIDAFEDGIMVACWHYGNNPAATWSGLDEAYDSEGTTLRRNSGALASGMTAEAGRTVGVTTSGVNAAALAVVSMR